MPVDSVTTHTLVFSYIPPQINITLRMRNLATRASPTNQKQSDISRSAQRKNHHESFKATDLPRDAAGALQPQCCQRSPQSWWDTGGNRQKGASRAEAAKPRSGALPPPWSSLQQCTGAQSWEETQNTLLQ